MTPPNTGIRQWIASILEHWPEIAKASKPRLTIHICKELSKVADGTRLVQTCQDLKEWFLDLLQQPVKIVDLKTRVSLLDLTFLVISKVLFIITLFILLYSDSLCIQRGFFSHSHCYSFRLLCLLNREYWVFFIIIPPDYCRTNKFRAYFNKINSV